MDKLPPCRKRKTDPHTGMGMCYAIGCCEIGDMPCECYICHERDGGKCKRRERDKRCGRK